MPIGSINEKVGRAIWSPQRNSNAVIIWLTKLKYLKKNNGEIITIIPKTNNLCFPISDFDLAINLVNKYVHPVTKANSIAKTGIRLI